MCRRHGESVWNITDKSRGLTARFTGWADVSLTPHGRIQAAAAGRCLQMFNLIPDAVYTSLLRRSQDTFRDMTRAVNIFHCPVINTWRLNERHYGALIGLSKEEAGEVLGQDKVMGWRRSWDLAPPPMDRDDYFLWRDAPWAQPVTIVTEPGKKSMIAREKGISMPETESLEDCAKRVKPIWVQGIAPRVANGETVLVVAHANSIRSMIKHIDNDTMDDQNVRDVHIPAATPLVYSFYLDKESMSLHKSGKAMTSDTIRRLKPLGEPSRLGMTGRYVASKEVIRLALQSSVPMEDEALKEGAPTFFDLIEKGLTDIMAYSEEQDRLQKEALVVSDGRGVIMHANSEWEKLCGFSNEEISGNTSKFLQGPLTEQDTLRKLDEKLRTGLPARTSFINYRKGGSAFRNALTIIPVYDWLRDDENDSSPRSKASQAADYGGSKTSNDYRQFSADIMHPSHFIARLDKTPDIPDLPPLTPEEMRTRDEQMKLKNSKSPEN